MEINLNHREYIVINPSLKKVNKVKIFCHNGILHITQENDLNDYIVTESNNFLITKKGN